MNPAIRRVLGLAFILVPSIATAQITTVISAPKRQQAAVQAAAQREAATQDSIARVTLTGMKEWVDSAANALALRPDTGVAAPETTRVAATPAPQRADSTTSARAPSTPSGVFRDGARAPNTATPWPSIAALGLALIAVGAIMRRRIALPAPTRL
jgi:hypothetical protein